MMDAPSVNGINRQAFQALTRFIDVNSGSFFPDFEFDDLIAETLNSALRERRPLQL
jgi:hypothetical protein